MQSTSNYYFCFTLLIPVFVVVFCRCSCFFHCNEIRLQDFPFGLEDILVKKIDIFTECKQIGIFNATYFSPLWKRVMAWVESN